MPKDSYGNFEFSGDDMIVGDQVTFGMNQESRSQPNRGTYHYDGLSETGYQFSQWSLSRVNGFLEERRAKRVGSTPDLTRLLIYRRDFGTGHRQYCKTEIQHKVIRAFLKQLTTNQGARLQAQLSFI